MNELKEKIKAIDSKLKRLEKTKKEVELKENAIRNFNPLYETLLEHTQDKVNNNKSIFLKEAISSLEIEKMDNLELIEVIDKQTSVLKDKNSKLILNELKGILEGISKLENKTYFDKDVFNKVFTNGITKIINVLVDNNEIPESTRYNRSLIAGKRKITKVTEDYTDHKLIYNWVYDSSGELVQVKTNREEIT
jgi:hypothetical protein